MMLTLQALSMSHQLRTSLSSNSFSDGAVHSSSVLRMLSKSDMTLTTNLCFLSNAWPAVDSMHDD
jgi:hypothetical protein